jgi:hypothetical protein
VLRWFEDDIVGRGRLPLLCCLVAFILTFFVARTFVRYIRHRKDLGLPPRWWEPRNIHIGAKHIHHVVIGVLLVMLSGVTLVALSVNGTQLEHTASAIVFGIGAALVLDEYALILHLSDVYWEEDGRTSVDAVFAAMAVGGLLVLGLHPFLFFVSLWHDTTHSVLLRAGVVFAMVLTLPLAVLVVLKGKVWTGLIGMFFVPLLVIGAIRLSRPQAPWARWLYMSQLDKMARALARERTLRRPVVRAKLWVQYTIAGTPRRVDSRVVEALVEREVHPAPPPPQPPERALAGGVGIR